jgi:hypothetical protein
MRVTGAVSDTVLTVVAAATVFTVMLTIGLGIILREFRWVWGHPALVGRALFSILVAVPAAAVLVSRGLALRSPRSCFLWDARAKCSRDRQCGSISSLPASPCCPMRSGVTGSLPGGNRTG